MPARADAGFTLLEVTIAFAIAALSLGAFYGGVAGGLRATGTAARYQAAPAPSRAPPPTAQPGDPRSPSVTVR